MDHRSHFSLFTHFRLRNAHPTRHHSWGPRTNTSAPYRTLGQLFSGEFAFSTTRAGGVIAWSYSSCQGCKPSPVAAGCREASQSQAMKSSLHLLLVSSLPSFMPGHMSSHTHTHPYLFWAETKSVSDLHLFFSSPCSSSKKLPPSYRL